MQPQVGVLGIGVHLPPTVRTNAWWPERIVAGWRRKLAANMARAANAAPVVLSEGQQKVEVANAEYADDPFQGAVQRHVLAEGLPASQMEILASREAIERSGVDAQDIDLVLSFTFCPDFLNSPNACKVHHELGLAERCFAMHTEAACNSFQMQLALAEQMIRGGQARFALLIQSSNLSRVAPAEEPFSAWFGDGATAVVVGPVGPNRGIVGRAHRTDGAYHEALVCGIPGKPWYDEGRVIAYLGDRSYARQMLLSVADNGRQIIHEALAQAGQTPDDVDFFACHQATPWFRRVTQDVAGLGRARAVDTFAWAGSLSAANIPLVLATAEHSGLLRDGDLVATYAGGTGITWSSLVFRWGR